MQTITAVQADRGAPIHLFLLEVARHDLMLYSYNFPQGTLMGKGLPGLSTLSEVRLVYHFAQ